MVPSVNFLLRQPSVTDDLEGKLATENLAASTTGVDHATLEASGLRPRIAWP